MHVNTRPESNLLLTLNGGTENTSAELQIEVIESQPDSDLNSVRFLGFTKPSYLFVCFQHACHD